MDGGKGEIVRIRGWGLIIDSNSDAGVLLGAMDKTYFFPGPESDPSRTLNRDTAWAFNVQTAGFEIMTNVNRMGISVGAHTNVMLKVPLDFHGTVFFETSSDNPVGRIHIQKEASQ